MVYYSKEEEENVRRKLKEGKSVSEIIEETGMTRRAVFRIKIKTAKEKTESTKDVSSKSLKAEISIEHLEEVMKELIRDRKCELVTNIANEIINNPNASDDAKAIMQEVLMKLDISEDRFDEARAKGKNVLDNKNISDETYNIIVIKLISVEIADKNYDKAEKMAYELLNKQGLKREDEIKLQAQLISTAIGKGEYVFATYRALQLLKCEDISEKTKYTTYSRLAQIARAQSKYKEAKNILKLASNGEDVSKIIEYVTSIMPEVEDVELWKDDIEIQEIVQSPKSKKESIQEKCETASELKDKRSAIYRNEISIEDINDLTEKNKDTLEGCLFIAETCSHFSLQHLGSNCLKGYRKNNTNLKQGEMKTLSKALELLKRDGLNEQRLREEWSKIYEYLEQSRDGEEIPM